LGESNQEILKKVKNLPVTMVLDMMKITNNFHVNVNLKTVVVILVRAESRWRINKKFAMSNKKKLINNSR
jgi:hypothetical protein